MRDAMLMKLLRKHHFHYISILLLAGGVLTIGYIFLVSYIEDQVESKLVAANAKTGSIQIDLFARSLHLHQLEIPPSQESPIGLQLKTLEINGIHLYALLIDKKIVINNIRADSGKFSYNKAIKKTPKDTSQVKLKSIAINKISITNITSEIRTDTIVNFSGMLNCQATGATVEINSDKMTYTLESFEIDSKEINVSQNSGMYGMKINQLRYSSEEKKLTIDSILLTPHYSKLEFAHKKGEQVARINISIPKLTIDGISLNNVIDSAFIASKIEVTSFDLHSFKDKRVPFLRTKHILLPMESLQKFGYPISVDSLIITESRVTIEEISENGTESGALTIDHINASCGLITNRYKEGNPKYAALKASGMLMNEGEVSAVFSLPLDGSPTYPTSGRLSKFPFEKLNPALENLARVKIESGTLNNLKFDFRYTDTQSVGTMEIDYQDLRIIGLNKKNDNTNDFKTLLINAIVKDSKDRSLAKGKRTGAINIERDRTKFIFNVWWKSILDGLKSSILGIENKPGQKKK